MYMVYNQRPPVFMIDGFIIVSDFVLFFFKTPFIAYYQNIQRLDMNIVGHIRVLSSVPTSDTGWHFSSIGAHVLCILLFSGASACQYRGQLFCTHAHSVSLILKVIL